jgi:hypothetical protein
LAERVSDRAFVNLVADILDTLNDRIRFLYDRDHQLGHSYFLDVTDASTLRVAFLDRIIPMLQEYFYGAWDKICIVLGCPYDESGGPKRRDSHLLDANVGWKTYAHPIVIAKAFQEGAILGFDHDDYEDRVDYRVSSSIQNEGISHEELLRSFLGVLSLDPAVFVERLAELQKSTKIESGAPGAEN